MLSVGCYRELSIAQLSAVQVLESSRSLLWLSVQAGISVRAHKTGRWTYKDLTCPKLLVFPLDIVHIV